MAMFDTELLPQFWGVQECGSLQYIAAGAEDLGIYIRNIERRGEEGGEANL